MTGEFGWATTGERERYIPADRLGIFLTYCQKEVSMSDYRSILEKNDPDVFAALCGEEARQREGIELIPSENYTYQEVLALLGSVFTNKYSEGYPGKRYYGGQEYTDAIEEIARERACAVFRAEHANVQPLSGSAMNQAVYLGLLEPGDPILAMELSHDGHLTHGAPVSHMGRLFNFARYKTLPGDGAIDYDHVRDMALEHRPKMLLCGYSSYPRDLDYAAFKRIADEVGALTMADISHYGGLVAGNAMRNPLDVGFDVVTTTTHKSLRGPRGGLILCREAFAKAIDSSVFPGLQGGPHMNQVAAVAVTLQHAASEAFAAYSRDVLTNAKALAASLASSGAALVTGGTDNHMLVIDSVASYGLDGREAQTVLDSVGITTNKQVTPDDPLPPFRGSGVRLGTPAATTRGMGTDDMALIGGWIDGALRAGGNAVLLDAIAREVRAFCQGFPVPGLD